MNNYIKQADRTEPIRTMDLFHNIEMIPSLFLITIIILFLCLNLADKYLYKRVLIAVHRSPGYEDVRIVLSEMDNDVINEVILKYRLNILTIMEIMHKCAPLKSGQ